MVQLSDQFGSSYFTKGGQGKFFPNQKPTAQHRYQRGYTPERMHEVRGAHIDFETPGHAENLAPSARFAHGQIHQAAAKAAQTVARSTANMHDYGQGSADVAKRQTNMEGNVGAEDQWPLHINMAGSKSGTAGTYRSGGTWDRGQINVDTGHSDEETSQTLMHEMGHYHSHKITPSESNMYNTPGRIGREEAHADDYMMTHWRPDPRDVRKGTSKSPRPVYESSEAFRGSGTKKAHGPYLTARTTLQPKEKKEIRERGYRSSSWEGTPFTHDVTGDRYSSAGPGTGRWHVQGALFNDRRQPND